MPSIDVAMARSLRGGVGEIIARSLKHAFVERDIVSETEGNIEDVKTAFSSWSNCMAAVYCKWPVIAVIIIGSLIVLSVVWCVARCLCCGLSCCCECCYCLKCCGNCCGCCDPPKGGRHKHLDEPYRNLPDDKGYQPHDPMSAGGLPWNRPMPTAKEEAPQYASFDISKNPESEDSLPAMPTWGDSESKKVQLKEEEVELQQLKKPETNELNAPLMNSMSPVGTGTPGNRSPVQGGVSPYGPPGNMAASGGYMGGAGAPGANTYNNVPGQGGHGQMHNAYAQSTTSFHTDQSWGVTGGAVGQDYGHAQSQVGYGQNGFSQEPDGYSAHDPYGANSAVSTSMNQPYSRAPPTRSITGGSNRSVAGAGAYPDRSRGSPAPSQGQFGSDRAFDPRIAPQRTYSPSPQQQQGQFANAPQRTYSPAPQQQGQFANAPQRTYSPSPQQQGQFGNPPQRSYSPAPQGPARTFSPAQGGPPRSFSPAPGPRSSPAPQRQWSADAAPGRGPPSRAPPYRQYSNDSAQSAPQPQRQFSTDSQRQRPMGNRPAPLANRAPPQRQYTADAQQSPRSPNFSRPTRSNTYDDSYGAGGGQEEQPAAYPGYKPYQSTR